jgi:hypothetical protein
MRYHRVIEVRGVRLTVNYETVDPRRHSQIPAERVRELFGRLTTTTDEWIATLDAEEFYREP